MRARGVAAAAFATALTLLLLWMQGLPPLRAIALLFNGAFGGAGAWVATLQLFAPLLLGSLAVLVSFRVGLWNIGAEGQLIVGALAAVAAAQASGHWLPALAAGAAAGFLFALAPAVLALWRGVPEVLSTLMLNGVALELLRWLVTGPLQEPTRQFPQTATIPDAARLPALALTRTGGIHVGQLLALALVLLVAFLFARSRIGLMLRAGAQSPRLVQATGFPLRRWRALAFALGGACAGLAGGFEVCGGAGLVDRSLAHGVGYAAVATALVARLHPLALVPAALFFAALASGTHSLQFAENLPGIDRFGLVLQGLAILAVLAALRLGRRSAASAASEASAR